jgi:tetratricopeptide (TPR) repeat protein
MPRLLLAAALLAGAAACSNGSGDPYRRGVAALAAGQPRVARVEFLNAIKARPNDAGLRLLQARTYLLLGDGGAAQAEIVRARALRTSVADTSHLMAHALFLQGRYPEAVEEANRASPAHAAYADRIGGKAATAAGDLDKAAAFFGRAQAASPKDAQLWTDIARFRRASADLGGALAAADTAVSLDPRNPDALSLRGELSRSQYGLAAAIPWFDRALEIDPDRIETLTERAATYGELGAMKAMLADTRHILSLAPANPMAFYLQAMLAARAGKFTLAQLLYQKTKGALDDQPAGMLLASAIALETGNAEQAVHKLQRLTAQQPDNAKARRLLAAAQWRLGDAGATVATLRPLADRPDADSYVLTLIGRALARQGDVAGASAYLARAALPQGRTATALIDPPLDDDAFAAIRASAEADAGDAGLQVQLIRALLGRGMSDEALARARQLASAHPGVPDAQILVGDALGTTGDFAGAAEAYRRAANMAFTEPVAMRLVEALRRSGHPAAAAETLSLFLQQNPQNVPARFLMASGYMEARQWDKAIALYEGLRQRIGNRDATLLNNLAWAWSEKGDIDRALPYAVRAWELAPRNPATADTLGWLLFKSGRNRAQGLALLQLAARGAPTDADIRTHLGRAKKS